MATNGLRITNTYIKCLIRELLNEYISHLNTVKQCTQYGKEGEFCT